MPQEVSHEFHRFLFSDYRYERKKFRLHSLVGHSYISLNVTRHSLLVMFVIIFQRHLLAPQLKLLVCVWKKYWKNLVNFAILHCISWFVTHASKAAHFSLSSSFSIFPLLPIRKWGNDIPSPFFPQVSLQIFMWWIDGSQRTIDLKTCLKNNKSIVLKKLDWR